MEIDQFLHSKIAPDECWHDFPLDDNGDAVCKHCGEMLRSNPHYVGSSVGFFKVWDWAKEQNWWEHFEWDALAKYQEKNGITGIALYHQWLINKDTFPVLVAEYLGYKKESE